MSGLILLESSSQPPARPLPVYATPRQQHEAEDQNEAAQQRRQCEAACDVARLEDRLASRLTVALGSVEEEPQGWSSASTRTGEGDGRQLVAGRAGGGCDAEGNPAAGERNSYSHLGLGAAEEGADDDDVEMEGVNKKVGKGQGHPGICIYFVYVCFLVR